MKKEKSIKQRKSMTLDPEAIDYLHLQAHKRRRSVSFILNDLILNAKSKQDVQRLD